MSQKILIEKLQSFKDLISLKLAMVDGDPHHPMYRISDALAEVVLSQQVRNTANIVMDAELSRHIYGIAKQMMEHGFNGMIAGWEDGDDICPPYFHGVPGWHGPRPLWQETFTELNPQPLPPHEFRNWASDEIITAEILRVAASLTVSKEANAAIKSVALQLMKGAASSKAYAEFEERCGSTGPRKPIPHRGLTVGELN